MATIALIRIDDNGRRDSCVHKLVLPFPIITLFKLIGSLPSLTSWVFWSYTALANRGG